MNNKVGRSFTKVYNYLEKNNTTILSGMAVVGTIGTALLAVKGKTKADNLLEHKQLYKMKYYNGEKLTRFEKFLTVTPAYIPAALMGIGTIACILGVNHICKEREAMLISAYSYLNCSYNEYKEKVKEIFGEEGEKKVREAIAKDHLPAEINPDAEKMTIYDEYGKRYFEISPDKFKEVLYDINKMYNFTGEMTLNNLYEFFDLDPVDGGNLLGWSALKDWECHGMSWIDISLIKMEMIDDYDCYAMCFNIDPSDDFELWTQPYPVN